MRKSVLQRAKLALYGVGADGDSLPPEISAISHPSKLLWAVAQHLTRQSSRRSGDLRIQPDISD